MTAPTFAATLRTYRERARLSQAKLAERCDLEHSIISRFECGDRQPSRKTVAALAAGLGLSGEAETEFILAAFGIATPEPLDPLALDVHAALGKGDETARMLRRVVGAMLGGRGEAVAHG